jgi:hypothetical protein
MYNVYRRTKNSYRSIRIPAELSIFSLQTIRIALVFLARVDYAGLAIDNLVWLEPQYFSSFVPNEIMCIADSVAKDKVGFMID